MNENALNTIIAIECILQLTPALFIVDALAGFRRSR